MKQTKIFWGFLLLIIALVTGCSKEDVGNNDTTTPPNTENKITLRASTGSDTRIGFEEATDKIKLTWKEADKFALYDIETGELAATFALIGDGGTANGTFETENTLTDGVSYTVCYPAIADATTLEAWEDTMETRQSTGQTVDMNNSNDPMAHLSDIFAMSQDYTYNASSPASIKFNPRYAMLTLEIAKPADYIDTDVPTSLHFVNGSATTKVKLANFSTWNEGDMLKIYALILPSTDTERTLSFALNSKGASYATNVSSSKAYEAGKRYTAEIKGDYALVTAGLFYQINNGTKALLDAETFPNALTDDNSTVFISTVGSTKMNNDNYLDLLFAINRSSRTGVTLDFSGAMAEKDGMVRPYSSSHSGIKTVSGFPVGITSLESAFFGFSSLTSVAEIPNSVTDMNATFNSCSVFNEPIIIPNSVTNMESTFYNCSAFNQPIIIPNSVTNISQAFSGCSAFNQSITIPDGVTDISHTFSGCSNFNQPITIPDGVTNMMYTFGGCTSFNQPITIPNSVTNMMYTFRNCTNFNQPITIPNSVTYMDYTFEECTNFNQPITIGNSVTNMEKTFYRCSSFNQPVTIPDGVTNMSYTFFECSNFNQPITIGNSVTNMGLTFWGCNSFNQPITIPNSVTNMVMTFFSCSTLASTITIYGANYLSKDNPFSGVNTRNIDLILGPNRTEWTSGNKWEYYTFKSITRASAE